MRPSIAVGGQSWWCQERVWRFPRWERTCDALRLAGSDEAVGEVVVKKGWEARCPNVRTLKPGDTDDGKLGQASWPGNVGRGDGQGLSPRGGPTTVNSAPLVREQKGGEMMDHLLGLGWEASRPKTDGQEREVCKLASDKGQGCPLLPLLSQEVRLDIRSVLQSLSQWLRILGAPLVPL